SYTSGGAKTDFRVTSLWKWNVRIKEDPDAIITAFTSGGNTGTNLTYNFTLVSSTSRYYMPGTLTATLVFFSPAGEFPEEERTISIPAHAITYQPSTHKGWAGSNIYWDQSLRGGNGALTFAPTPSSTPDTPTGPETYQGVYFKWGSLVGQDPGYSYTITDSDKKSGSADWSGDCRVYIPTWNPDNPTASSWASLKASNSVPVYTDWADISYVKDGVIGTGIPYLTRNDATPTNLSDNKGGHVPVSGEAVLPANMRGDICRYLTQTGDAPGADTGTKWRMPMAQELLESGATYEIYGNVGSTLTSSDDDPYGTYSIVSGYHKTNTVIANYAPRFPTNGHRESPGRLYNVNYDGYYWSSSPNSPTDAYHLHFVSYLVLPNRTLSRTFSMSVRCVKE
ncbi:MAG: hypothetical protein LBR26_17575, partial [Prevotella sp.]|nr:hypothetical protein [Prevotella sp.]